jgi:chromosome segregation ATPase
MDSTITIILLLAAFTFLLLWISTFSKTNALKSDLDKSKVEQDGHLKEITKLQADLKELRQELKNAQANAARPGAKKDKSAPSKSASSDKIEAVGIDPAELEKAQAEIKRLKKQVEDTRADLEGKTESVKEAQATFAGLREERDDLRAQIKTLEKSVEDSRSRANRDVERAAERAAERAEEKSFEKSIAAPNADISQELKKEKARLEEKYADKLARLEERLKQRDEKDKQRDDRREAGDQSKAARLERQLQEARDFIKKKGSDLAVANYRLINLEKSYKAAKSDVELLKDQVAHLKGEVPVYTAKAKETEAEAPTEAPLEASAPAETPTENT